MKHHYYTFVFLSFLFLLPFSTIRSQDEGESLNPSKIITPVHHDVLQSLRDVTPVQPGTLERSWKEKEIQNQEDFQEEFNRPSTFTGPDPVLQDNTTASRTDITINQNFSGNSNLSLVAPPDTDGDVGPDEYFQMVNLVFSIYSKSGALLYGPADIITLWDGFSGPWSSTNDGDPVVLYDEYADRWIATQFALPNYPSGPFYELIAVSQTGDPTGAWNRYAYQFDNMPDYPKFGIWPDGYYFSINQFAPPSLNFAGAGICVLDRDAMINGDPNATMVFFSLSSSYGSLLPADADGATQPPSGSPNYFMNLGSNTLRIWEVAVNWNIPNNSTATLVNSLTTASFSYSGITVSQPGTSQTLDVLSSRLMYRLQYRNFGSYQAMVTNHTVNVGNGRAGVRWYELRNTGNGWSIYQQGTYAPADGNGRWMGSIAMNDNGDIALGYSVSGSSQYPSIRVAGQTAGAPDGLGVLDIAETSIHEGAASQTGVNRWGDYSTMTVDPSDGTSFWYTSEYSNGGWNWRTQIASISYAPPVPVAPTADFTADATYIGTGGAVHFQDQSTGIPDTWSWSFTGGTPAASSDQNPTIYYNTAGTYSVSLTVSNTEGTDSKTITDYITVDDNPIIYCDAQGNNWSEEWISDVQFDNFNNSSGAAGYTDFTDLSIPMDAGSTVSISLTPGFSGRSYREYWSVWIDYNKNGDFTDAGEQVFSGAGRSSVSGSFNVPAGVTGDTRIRIAMKYGGYASPCETFSYGEVEDYTVSFNSSNPVAPVADFTANATTVAEGDIVNFTDQSTNIPTSWAWTFTGGNPSSSTAQNPSIQYDNAGSYTVELTATNDAGSDTKTKVNYISVMALPVADFTSDATTVDEGQSINFTDLSSNATSWSWNFPGGTPSTSTAQNPTITYNTSGTYTVELTASNAVGSDTKTMNGYITVNNVVAAPVADFTADATSIYVGETVNFTDMSSNEPTSWSWAFTGGTPSTSTTQNPSVTYDTEGTYDVSLTATNSVGSGSETKTAYINVAPAPTSVTLSFTDFENGWGIWSDGGGDCMLYSGTDYAWSGTGSADIQDNSDYKSSFYMTNGEDVNTPGYVQIDVEFYFIGISMENGEDFFVQYYDGSNWNNVADFVQGTDFSNNTFYVATVTILESDYTFPTDMKLRFMCDASDNNDDVYIDDITVTASTTQTNGPVKMVDVRETDRKSTDTDSEEYSLYPNPAQESLYILSQDSQDVEVFIYNTSGQMVQHVNLAGGESKIDISKLDDGVYLVNIKSDDEVFTKKFIKK